MAVENLPAVVEALIFAADEPLSVQRLLAVLEDPQVQAADIADAVEEIRRQSEDRAFELVEVAGGFRFMTRAAHAEWIRKYKTRRAESRLSKAALETLSIVAYKQPLVRSEIDAIRGVQTGPTLRTLMDRGLVKIVGRSEEIGRPVQYGTTRRFLEFFGLNSLKDLPQLEEI
jgi:segregation and condensation protein B